VSLLNVKFIPLKGPAIVFPVLFSENDNASTILKQAGITKVGDGTTVVGVDAPKLDRTPLDKPHYSDRSRLEMRLLFQGNVAFSVTDPPAIIIEEKVA